MSELYKTATITRLTGFSPALLRAWERRHGLLDPDRSDGGHRLYTEDDLRVLLASRALIDAGRAIGEIAALGRQALLERRDALSEGAQTLSVLEPDDAEHQALRDRLLRAAIAVDPRAADAVLDELFVRYKPELAVHAVLMPASRAIGEAWVAGTCSVAGEHLVSSRIRELLGRLLRWAERAPDALGAEAIVACFPDELHENGALSTAFLLARRGFAVTYLGAALPWADLRQVVAEREPSEVFLSVSQKARFNAERPVLLELVAQAPSTRFWIGGRGAPRDDEELAALGAVVGPNPALHSLVAPSARPRKHRR